MSCLNNVPYLHKKDDEKERDRSQETIRKYIVDMSWIIYRAKIGMNMHLNAEGLTLDEKTLESYKTRVSVESKSKKKNLFP